MPNRPKRIAKLVEKSRKARAEVRRLAANGMWARAETSGDRLLAFFERRAARLRILGAEAVQGATLDFQPASFLSEGAAARRAVAYVEVDGPGVSTCGSGFLISPRLFITNQHVIPDAAAARAARITFDMELDERGVPRAPSVFVLDPDAFALFSDETKLDYAVVAVGQSLTGLADVASFGHLPLSNAPDRHVLGMPVNIIQHPGGRRRMIAIRNNLLTFRTPRTLLYETDTETGSSGAPVLNDDWDVIALHHWAGPALERVDEKGVRIPSEVNEGVRISAIVEDLERRARALRPGPRELLEEALRAAPTATPGGPRRLLGPRAAGSDQGPSFPERESGATMTDTDATTRLVVPLEITVRLAGQSGEERPADPAPRASRLLRRGAEGIRIDRDYGNRGGYRPGFVPGVTVPLPKPVGALAGKVAPLRAGEPDFAAGELKYEHFSVKLHKTRRMAIFTATNIDGTAYLRVDRDTGEVVGPEGDSWYADERISDGYYLGKAFYKDWSTFFDRGHLTRRTDPTWGKPDEATRANADTFHLTNCSPQHFRFNQTTPYWQGAERYILENGLLEADPRRRVSVFQGPIFDDAVDRWADDVQIPSSFFKVIVWKGANVLRSVALVVDQGPLLDEERKYLGKPTDVPSVDVSQWRVPIAEVERRTQLDFGAAVRKADTSAQPGQPRVGAEARRRIKSLADILG